MSKILLFSLLLSMYCVAENNGLDSTSDFVPPVKFQKVIDVAAKSSVYFPPLNSILAMSYSRVSGEFTVVMSVDGGGQRVIKIPLSGAAYDEILSEDAEKPVSAEFSSEIVHAEKQGGTTQDGRVYFMMHTTLKSLYLYPNAIYSMNENIQGQVLAGVSLLIGGGSLYGSYIFSKDIELGYGRVAFMNYGGEMLGFTYPKLLGLFLHYGTSVDKSYNGEFDYFDRVYTSDKISAALSIAGLPLGIYLGSKVDYAGNHQYGNASIMTDLSRWGYMYGFLLPWLFDDNLSNKEQYTSSALLTMGFIPAGFVIGKKLVEGKDYSSGRSFMVASGGVMGAVTGALLPTFVESDNYRAYIIGAMLGHVGGTCFGFKFMEDNDYTFGQGVFMGLSAACGAAVALSLPLIAESREHRAFTASGIIGGWAGFVLGENLSRSIFDSSERDKRAESNISFPVVWQWPSLAGTYLLEHKSGVRNRTSNTPIVELVRMKF